MHQEQVNLQGRNSLVPCFNLAFTLLSVLRIRIRWIRKIASWIRMRKNMRIRIQGVKYHPKTAKKKSFLLLNPKSELLKKDRLKKFPHF